MNFCYLLLRCLEILESLSYEKENGSGEYNVQHFKIYAFLLQVFLCSDFRVILDFFLYGKYFPNKLFCHHLKVVLKFVVTLVVHSTLGESRTIH